MTPGRGPLIHEWSPAFRNWLLTFVALMLGLALVLALVTLIDSTSRPSMRDWSEIVRNVGLGAFGIVGGAFGLYIAYLRSVAAKDAAEAALQASKTAQEKENRERELDRESHRLDRETRSAEAFSKAMEQLGSDKLSVRLGGIYSLELIARADKERHAPILTILLAKMKEICRDEAWVKHASITDIGTQAWDRTLTIEEKSSVYCATEELQLCIDFFAKRDLENDPVDFRLELSGLPFCGIRFWGNGFTCADFENSDFYNVRFENGDFSETRFFSCNFVGVAFSNANLDHASFSGGATYEEGSREPASRKHFSDIKFENLSGRHISFFDYEFKNCSFSNVDLTGSDFVTGNLIKTIFIGSKLSNVHFKNKKWKHVSVISCDYPEINTDLAECTMIGVEVEDSKFYKVRFQVRLFDSVSFKNTTFDAVDFAESRLGEAEMEMCNFFNSDLGTASEQPRKNVAPTVMAHNPNQPLQRGMV
ncbi:pentapeptide repeat-containing protein [Halotia wernerae UHCC 0503]|nr:pentapeptide repeat-containing protein [Halotia wernerae UHCC 0503]